MMSLILEIIMHTMDPLVALASGAAQQGIDAAAGQLPSLAAPEFGDIAEEVARYFVPIVNGVAITFVVVAGLIAAFSQSEDQISGARRAVIGGVGAIMLVNLAEPIRKAITPVGINLGGNVSIGDLAPEISGVADWIASAAAVVAVLMIIISGIRAVVSYGSDSGLQHIKRALIACIAGFTLIAFRSAIRESLTGSGSPGNLTQAILTAINTVLGFIGLIAVIVIVIAGIMMVANIGNDEQYTRAKNLILRVAIGLLVIIASAAISNLVFLGN